jgi:hypothetical protein
MSACLSTCSVHLFLVAAEHGLINYKTPKLNVVFNKVYRLEIEIVICIFDQDCIHVNNV